MSPFEVIVEARALFKDMRKFSQMADLMLQGQYPVWDLYQALAIAAMCRIICRIYLTPITRHIRVESMSTTKVVQYTDLQAFDQMTTCAAALIQDENVQNYTNKCYSILDMVTTLYFHKGKEGRSKMSVPLHMKQIVNLVEHLGRSFFLSRLFELEVRSKFADYGEVVEKVWVLP